MPRVTRSRKPSRKCNSSASDVTSTSIDSISLFDDPYSKEAVVDKMKENVRSLDYMLETQLRNIDFEFKTLILKQSKEFLNTKVNLNDPALREAVLDAIDLIDGNDTLEPPSPATPKTVKRRRSKSAEEQKLVSVEAPTSTSDLKKPVRISTRFRSSSAGINGIMTPANKVRLSTLKSTNKYTVSKPRRAEENTGFNMKRIMRPNEEAISVSGSPLYVHPSMMNVPHVNIPLPGGVVLNIEPKKAKGPLDVPQLDDATRNQLKILCEQLNNMF